MPTTGLRWDVVIPGWLPARANQLMRCHWQVRRRLRRQDDDVIALHCIQLGVPMAGGKRRVSLSVTLAPRQRVDPDCFWKSVLDALTNCGRLVDDDYRYVELGPVTIGTGPARKTVITLEDV